MAKVSKTLNAFDGGLVTFVNAKDINDNEASELKGFSIRNLGSLVPLGGFVKCDTLIDPWGPRMPSDVTFGSFSLPSNGAPFFVFSTDKKLDNSVNEETYIAYVERGTGTIFIHSKSNNSWQRVSAQMSGLNGIVAAISNEDASFYFADGGLRVCNTDFNHTTAFTTNDCSTILLSQINRQFLGGGVAFNDWTIYSSKCFPPVIGNSATDGTQSFLSTINFSSAATGGAISQGQFGLTLGIERDKGDGTVEMRGRTIYASFTYDNNQESLPKQIGIITNANITALAPPPTEATAGFQVTTTEATTFGAGNILLSEDVLEQTSGAINAIGISEAGSGYSAGESWTTSGGSPTVTANGTISSVGSSGEITGLKIDEFGDGYSSTPTIVVTSSGGSSATFTVTLEASTVSAWEESGLVTVTDALGNVQSLTYTGIDGSPGASASNYPNGSTLTGVTGWVDNGECSLSYTIDTVTVASGGEGYESSGGDATEAGVTWTTTNGGASTAASGTCDINSGVLSNFNIVNYGNGFTSVPTTISLAKGGNAYTNTDVSDEDVNLTFTLTSELTTKTLCEAKGGTWTDSNLASGATVEYDLPGDLQEADENLAIRPTLTFRPKDKTGKKMLIDELGGARITHVNLYTNKFEDDAGSIPEITDYAYIGSFDLINGFKKTDGTFNAWASDTTQSYDYGSGSTTATDQYTAIGDWWGTMSAENYQSRTGLFPDTWDTHMRWKSATVLNRRVYAGNIVQKPTGNSAYRHYPDRILKSMPNQFDTFNDYDVLDVVVDDGDEIVALTNIAGQLLQFKKNALYIIDVTSEPEFLKNTFKFRGIDHRQSYARTDEGVLFGNENGAFYYNGDKMSELVTSKMESDWNTFYAASTYPLIVGFHPKTKQGFFVKQGADVGFAYNLGTDSFTTFGDKRAGLDTTAGNHDDFDNIGDFIEYEGELVMPRVNPSTFKSVNTFVVAAGGTGYAVDAAITVASKTNQVASATAKVKTLGGSNAIATIEMTDVGEYEVANFPEAGDVSAAGGSSATLTPTQQSLVGIRFYKWTETLSSDLDDDYLYVSKEFDFMSPSTDKIVSKVYMTYKASGDSNLRIKLVYNDGNSTTEVATSPSEMLDSSGNYVTKEYTPVGGSFTCKTIKIKIHDDGSGTEGAPIDVDFSLNDISIIYKEKRVK